MVQRNQKVKKLKKIIQSEVFVTKDNRKIISRSGTESAWLFDFRNILLQPDYIDLIADIFWDRFQDRYPFQVGGLEVAAIPLISAIVMKSKQKDRPVNGFFIRKSRKKDGLLKMIEGKINDEKIILVDDLINSGKTFIRQIKVVEGINKKAAEIFTILNFRDLNVYDFAKEKNITITSLFSLPDFGLEFRGTKSEVLPKNNFHVEWYFKGLNPNYFYVVTKSTPVLDADKIYFGSDSGNFWALKQNNGAIAWKYKVGWHAKGKSIFSSPALYNNTVYFGSYDGNVYALDTKTGKRKWVFMEADWVGSSPALAPDLGLLFIGLEFGLFKKRGGIAALDLDTGEKKWEYIMPEFTHASPAYLPSKNIVAIGCNDSAAYLFNSKTGKLLWKYQTEREIKASCAFDEKRGHVCFGSLDGFLYILDIRSGKLVYKYQTEGGIYSTPLIYNDTVYFASLDKRLYSLDLKTHTLNWSFATNGRIFASPEIIHDKLYIGSNDGRMYEIDLVSGKELDFFQATERITNKIAYNHDTDRFFVLTFANEIYCLKKNIDKTMR